MSAKPADLDLGLWLIVASAGIFVLLAVAVPTVFVYLAVGGGRTETFNALWQYGVLPASGVGSALALVGVCLARNVVARVLGWMIVGLVALVVIVWFAS